MTPLQGADYIKEVTQCLSQSMVQLLQIKPRDPIEYLARSLQAYRRNHPRDSSNRNGFHVSAGRANNHCDKHDENETNPTQSKDGRSESGVPPEVTVGITSTLQHAIKDCGNDEEENEDDTLFSGATSEFSHVNIVHKQYRRVMLGIGDLFDDDDLG